MSASATPYNQFKYELLGGGIDLDTDTINCALLTSAYTPDIDAHHYWTDVSASEVAGTGYTAGGLALSAGASISADDGTDRGVWDANDLSWSSATLSNLRYAVLYKDTGDAATSPLIAYQNFGEEKTITNGTFSVSWSTSGIALLS